MNSQFGSLTATDAQAPLARALPSAEGARPASEEIEDRFRWAAVDSAATGAISRTQRIEGDLQRSLIALDAALLEDYGVTIQPGSRAGLMRFIRANVVTTKPTLGAEPAGHIVATWRHGQTCISLRFMDAFRFHFALTEPGLPRPTRSWGEAHALTFVAEHPQVGRFISA